MSEGNSRFTNMGWLGDIYHKMDTLYYEDTVRSMENRVLTAGENVGKFLFDVIKDLQLSSLNPVINEEFLDRRNYFSSDENLKANFEEDSKEKPFSSEDPELTCSNGEDSRESTSQSSSINKVKEVEIDSKEEKLSSSEISKLKCSHPNSSINEEQEDGDEDIHESPSPSSYTNNYQEGIDDFVIRVPLLMPTNGPQSNLPQRVEPLCNPVLERVSDISDRLAFSYLACRRESKDKGTLPSSSSLLLESSEKEGKNCQEYADLRAISMSTIQPYESYLSDRSPCSSTNTLSLDFAGTPNASIIATDGLPLPVETIDLSEKVKLDDSCVTSENHMNLSIPSRRGLVGSLKKKLHNAFASNKRLEKEYKQLAILSGDIDDDFTQLIHGDVNDSTVQDVEENEWEFI